jgi:raffinose/stachyose/melibiose transport system substrate-binding protein
MKRIVSLSFALLLVFSAFALYANGSKESTASSTSAGQVTLDIYNYVDVTSPDYAPFKTQVIVFEQEYPNIKLHIQNLFNDPYHQKLQAMAVAGQIPDVVYLWPSARTGYVTSRGLIKDLTSLLGDKKADFQPSAVAAQGPKGQLWELPHAASTATSVVYANDNLLKKLGLTYPKTLADLIAQSAKIRAAGYTPIAMDDKDGWEVESCLLSSLVGRLGGNKWINDANNQVNGAKFTDPQFVNALDILKQMTDAKLFDAGISTNSYGTSLQLFEQGKAVYTIDGDWRVNQLQKDLVKSPDQLNAISMHPFPAIPGQIAKDNVSNIPSTGYGMNAKLTGAKEKAAWDWIWFDAGPKGSAIHLANGIIPSYQKLDYSQFNIGSLETKQIQFYKDIPGVQTVLDGIMAPKPVGILNPDLQQILLGQKTPQQVGKDIQDWYNQNPPSNKG